MMSAEHLIKSIAGIYTDCLNLALEEARKNTASDSMDLGTMVSNATWSAYCEGLEAAISMVDLVTQKSFQVLAEQRMKAEGMRSLQDPIELEGPDMNAAYPKVQ